MEEFCFLLKIQNTVHINEQDSYKTISNKEVNKYLEDEYDEYKSVNSLTESSRKYELAYIRAKRFFKTIDKHDCLQKSYIDKIQTVSIGAIESKLSQNQDVEAIFIEYATKLFELKENAIKTMAILREGL